MIKSVLATSEGDGMLKALKESESRTDTSLTIYLEPFKSKKPVRGSKIVRFINVFLISKKSLFFFRKHQLHRARHTKTSVVASTSTLSGRPRQNPLTSG